MIFGGAAGGKRAVLSTKGLVSLPLRIILCLNLAKEIFSSQGVSRYIKANQGITRVETG